MRVLLASSLIAFTALFGTPAFATDEAPAPGTYDTPVGTWTQVDDKTGRPKSIIEISKATDGTLQGVVRQVLFSEQGPHPVCDKCEGSRHGQPVEGMTIMWGVRKDGDQWDGGQILDPHNGKIYKVRLRLTDNGRKLDVHGYIGFSLLGRSQVWERKTVET
jgi:uncharacterized protein (DUF2147 family)